MEFVLMIFSSLRSSLVICHLHLNPLLHSTNSLLTHQLCNSNQQQQAFDKIISDGMDRESLMINKSHLDGPVPAPPSSSKKDKHLAGESSKNNKHSTGESSRPKKRVLETTPTPRERLPKRLRPTSPVADEQPRTLQAPTIKIPGLRSMASELANKAVGLVGEHAWDFMKRHFGYLIFYKSNINDMEKKFGELDQKRKDVDREVETAYRERLEEVKIEVQAWLDNVKKVEEEVKRIKDEASDANNNGFHHFRLHYTLGSQAADQIQAIDDLLVKKGGFNEVYTHSRPPPSTTGSLLVNEKYVMFDSRKKYINEILEALKDENVYMVGVYGLGGIGKTTLVKEAANQAKNDDFFTEVVMVTVSQNLDVKRIQTDMAQSLRLQLDGEATVEVRADMIERRLGKEGNRVLVILDDLWEMLELSKVKIPHDRNNKGTCKVLITTRREDVCDQMDCQEKVELRTLSDEESWSLFKSRAGNIVVESLTMKEVAWDVAKQCAGLPLALVVLGTALKGKELKIWKTMLEQLKKSTIAVDLPGVNKKVRESIELSYNFLESEAAKWCFLYCCLYPEDFEFDLDGDEAKDLMHMLVGGGLLEDFESLHEAQDRVDVLLDQLKASGLLLDVGESTVRMHDVVRDVAIWIGGRDHGFFVRTGQGLEGYWPRNSNDAEKLQNCQRLSLMSNEIDGLPSDPIMCTKLETLILSENMSLRNIPEKFFQHMGALKVLDLRGTHISCLPESLSCLTNLRVLKLEECNDISLINGLKMLEILVLKDTREVSVVLEDTGKLLRLESTVLQPLQCLPNLKYLQIIGWQLRCGLAYHHEIEMAAANPFLKLESLHISDCMKMSQMISSSSSPDAPLQGMCIVFQNLRVLDVARCPRLTHLFWSKQAKHMQQLTSLQIWDCESLRAVVISNENQEEGVSASTSTSTTAYVVVDHGSQCLIFSRLEELNLYNLPQLESVLQPFQCLPNLMELDINDCGLRCGLLVYHEMEMAAADPFPKLEILEIYNCKEMSQMISSSSSPYAPLQAGMCIVFQNLRHLYVSICPRLTHLFWSKQAKHMQQLTKLHISNCKSLRAVVISNDHKPMAMTQLLPKLAELNLKKLRQLESVLQPFQCLPNLMELKIWDCGLRRGLAFHHEMEMAAADPFPKLEKLDIRGCMEMSQMISSSSSPDAPLQGMCIVFQNLCDLYVSTCPRLTHLFWSKQAKHMQQLTSLEIEDCDSLTAVVISNENQEQDGASASTSTTACAFVDHHHGSQYSFFPRLKTLKLIRLPNMVAFHQPTALPMEWPCLEKHFIYECPKVETPLLGSQTSERIRQLKG